MWLNRELTRTRTPKSSGRHQRGMVEEKRTLRSKLEKGGRETKSAV
jgi:hypothetical protein